MALTREKVLLQELNEANIRTYQLEKTAKWWSECTATWREKWGKVRGQRNKLREDYIVLKGQYSALTTEYSKIKMEKDNLKHKLAELKPEKQVARIEPLNENKDIETIKEKISEKTGKKSPKKEKTATPELPEEYKLLEEFIELDHSELNIEHFEPQVKKINSEIISDKLSRVKDYVISCDEFVQAKNKEIVELESKNLELSEDFEKLQEQYHEDMVKNTNATSSRKYGCHTAEFKIRELHSEIQRLQQENCNEWTKRERCETEMAELRRELKSANHTIQELKHTLVKRKEEISKVRCVEMNLLKEELKHKSEGFIEFKAALNKVKKQLKDKTDALDHEQKRTEHYETEMKKLRTRIDQLKKQLLTCEEKNDLQENHIRRLQRAIEEQTQQKEALQFQLKHLLARIKRHEDMSRTKADETTDDDDER